MESKTDKTLIRMIQDSLQAFGPNLTGSNLLLNRFINKEESLFSRIERILDAQMERNLEESKLPAAAFKLAPTSNSETVPGSKEEAQKIKRQGEVQ